MTTEFSDAQMQPSQEDGACISGASIADILRLLGAGATGAILMALGEGPLRTMELTQRVPGYVPRTIYRYSSRLAELEVLERKEEAGVPSKVVYTLSDPCGTELYNLVNRFADASMTRLPDGRIDAHAWAALGLLADLWEAGMVAELACEPRSPTELARGPHGLSYHQVNRRAGLFRKAGLLGEEETRGRRRSYALTKKTRRTMGLIVGIARWRHHHVAAEDEEGITPEEMATVLQAALPLVSIPQHAEKFLELRLLGEGDPPGGEGEVVRAEVEAGGTAHACIEAPGSPHGWGRGKVGAWVPAILDGRPDGVLVGGDEELVSDCLAALSEVLWRPEAFD
jgi:DNA-binding HxlR family transcriptional regulator